MWENMDIIELILFIFPAYVANSAPVILSGWGPLDHGALFTDGRRLLGDSKTIRGTLGGIIAGLIVGMAFILLWPSYLADQKLGEQLFVFTPEQKLMVTIFMVLGAILGDLLGSFFKRRLEIEPGQPLLVTDQLLFILMAVALSTIPKGFFITIFDLLVVIGITLVIHILANVIAHRLNLKKVPW